MDWRLFIEEVGLGRTVSPLLTFGVLLLTGALGGVVARWVRLPTITGNIFAGVLIGPYCFGLVKGEETIQSLQWFSNFAMNLITVYIGGHLSWRRIHNALKRIAFIGVGEAVGASLAVGLASWLITGNSAESLLLAALAMASAPATILHIVKETRAKGTFVKTLLSSVAVDNILAIIFFSVILTFVHDFYLVDASGSTLQFAIWHIVWRIAGSVLLGLLLGGITAALIKRPQFHNFSTVFLAVLFSEGISSFCGISTLLTSLTIGVYLGNSSSAVEEELRALEPIEWLMFICFFTLAGVTLHLDELQHIGWLGVAFVVMRVAGKSLGALAGGVLAGSSRRIWQNIPLGLMPQAGLAIALLVILQSDERIPFSVRSQISTMVLAAVVVNEIFGPIATRLAIQRARETDKDRPRLMEFLQEEFIMTGLKAYDKFDAIRQLTDFMVRTHRVEYIHPEEIYHSILKREKEDNTAIGLGCAIPHGAISNGPAIEGVMGISAEGVDWGAPDGHKVHLIVLIATPTDHRQAHLKVLASVAAMARDEVIRSRLTTARDANEAWEIIESEETPNYNYFLEGE